MNFKKMWLVIVVVTLALTQNCFATVVRATDLFGTERISIEELIKAEPALWSSLYTALEVEGVALGGNDEIRQIVSKLEDSLRSHYDLPYVHISIINYFQEEEKEVYLTIDIVEQEDAERRLNFNNRPKGKFNDPDGLIAQWDEYQQLGYELLEKGEIGCEEVKCRAFHSIFGHQHPQFAPFEQLFIDGVTKNKNSLIDILHNDASDNHRATAPFLLAYLTDGQELADIIEGSISDPSSWVRNNVLRVYMGIAIDHPEIVIPIGKILNTFNYPDTTDRNKAAAIIHGVLSHDTGLAKFGKTVLISSGDTLLKMLQLRQPNNSDWAHLILQRISGLALPKDDITQWSEWLKTNAH